MKETNTYKENGNLLNLNGIPKLMKERKRITAKPIFVISITNNNIENILQYLE